MTSQPPAPAPRDDFSDEGSVSDIQPIVPPPGFSRQPPPAALPGFDPSQSPLVPGGRAGTPQPVPTRGLHGLLRTGVAGDQPRVTYRVRREGWVSRREAARSRFRTITGSHGSSIPRVLAGLNQRHGGLLERSKGRASRSRFKMRGR